jgi:spore germination protein GerM
MSPVLRRSATAAAAIAVVVLAGCGVPLDREPRPISQTTIAPAATVPTTVAPSGAPTVSVYFLNGDRLEAQQYPVEGEATLGDALGFVLAAPPDDATSLRTSVPPDTRLRGVTVDEDGLATIDLSGEIDDVSGPTQKEAFAQIVFTALGFDEVQQVRFLVDGEAIDAPTDDGNVAVISADDYEPPLNPR